MRPETYFSAIILFLATTMVIYGVYTIVQPKITQNEKTKKFVQWKAFLIAVIISVVFTGLVSYASEKIDSMNNKSRK